MTVHRVMTFGKIVCDMDPKALTLLIDSVRPAGIDKPADCALCAAAIRAASAPAAQLVRDTVRSVPAMTLAEKLEELTTRYVTVQHRRDGRMVWGAVGNVVHHAVGQMTYGDTRAFALRDQYGLTGQLILVMSDTGRVTWTCTGKIEQALAKLR